MRSHVPARLLLAAALIALALLAQLALLSGTGTGDVVTRSAAEDSGGARPATVSMARKYPPRGRTMFRAAVVATRYWTLLPCGGRVQIRWKPMPMYMNAMATWSTGSSGDPRRFFNCRIAFNSRIDFDWGRLCTTMAHEVGHLLGQRHTSRPRQVMSATYRGPARPCLKRQPLRKR